MMMTEIGQLVDTDYLMIETKVKPGAFRGGILVNNVDRKLILIQKTSSKEPLNYPNYWDEKCIGLLHYCGTNKHQSKEIEEQNLNVQENDILNKGTYPIYVYLYYQNGTYRYLGTFSRLPKYDDVLFYNGKRMHRFGLISNNIEAVHPYIDEIISKGQVIIDQTE